MLEILRLAMKSLLNRRVTTSLTIATIALSVVLLLGIERIRLGAEESFAQSISQTDLIVGPRGSGIGLLLYSVFQIGVPNQEISFASFKKFTAHPAVKWTVPISLGDSHRGFRVVATTDEYFKHYKYARERSLELSSGAWANAVGEVVLGEEVARKLGYTRASSVVIAHGMGSGPAFVEHTSVPFHVVGILRATQTPVDRALYISLESMEAMHGRTGEPKDLTAFFIGTQSRTDGLRLQREINEYTGEPLLAILPGLTLAELWSTLSTAENSLRIVAAFVVIVSILGMLISLYTTLGERRREIAILRALGGTRFLTLTLFTFESSLLSFCGCLAGVVSLYVGLLFALPLAQKYTGVEFPITALRGADCFYLLVILLVGTLSGVLIGLKAHRTSLDDGLAMRL